MQALHQILSVLGCSPAEISVYSTILDHPNNTSSALAKLSGLRPSVTYYTLDRLVQKGLISCLIQNNKKRYVVGDTSYLTKLLEEKERKIQLLKQASRHIKPARETGSRTVRFFEGWNAIASAFHEAISSSPKKCTALSFVIGPLHNVELFKKKGLLNKIVEARKEKQIITKVIVTEGAKSSIGLWHKQHGASQIRVIGDEFENPVVVNIYGPNVLIGMYDEIPTAILIKHAKVAESFGRYFSVIWDLSKPM